jgi:hypothetical protein
LKLQFFSPEPSGEQEMTLSYRASLLAITGAEKDLRMKWLKAKM